MCSEMNGRPELDTGTATDDSPGSEASSRLAGTNSSPQLQEVLATAVKGHRAGWTPIPIQANGKRPATPGWTKLKFETSEEVKARFTEWAEEGHTNVGVLLGERSSNLVDIDLDHPMVNRLKRYFLPPTDMVTGRPGNPASHWWYQVEEGTLPSSRRHMMPDGAMAVEFRSSKAQTLLPPSTHPSGEQYMWHGAEFGTPERIDGQRLATQVALLALGTVLIDAWPTQGGRHEAYLALAGGMLRNTDGSVHPFWETNLPVLISALADATHDDDGAGTRVAEVMESTLRRIRRGDTVQGFGRLGEIIGKDHARQARVLLREVESAAGHKARQNVRVNAASADVESVNSRTEGVTSEQPNLGSDGFLAIEEEFFSSRPLFGRLRDFARARRVSPWALLGAILTRAAAAVPPSVVLPPTIGSVASLNIFTALCGVSGSGKSAVTETARDFLLIEGGVETLETSPGSGEGLISAYVHSAPENGKVKSVQARASVQLEVDEVQALGSLTSRTASTLQPFLKSAWSGKMLATQNADPARQRWVGAHKYRLSITAGVQPANASILLDDTAGGFPQRWLWLPTYDPGMLRRDAEVTEPEPFTWYAPVAMTRSEADGPIVLPGRTVMQLPDEAVEAILDAAEKRNRPIGTPLATADALDGHALLSRAKVAALLALLDSRAELISSEDWALAGVVMEVSDSTRGEIIAVNAQTARDEADKKAERQGRNAAIAADTQADIRVAKTAEKIVAKLNKGEQPRGQFKNDLRRYREEFDEALERLLETGIVEVVERKNSQGNLTEYLRRAGA